LPWNAIADLLDLGVSKRRRRAAYDSSTAPRESSRVVLLRAMSDALRTRSAGAKLRVALLAAAGCAALLGCGPKPTHLVLITIDTLRADHLGVYGYARDTSPALDALAREGKAFSRCYAQSVATRASHASLFTASYPRTHGVLSNFEIFLDRPSLFTALRASGYTTAGFVSSAVLNKNFGLQRQLDHFDDSLTSTELNRPSMAERPARDTLAAALAYIEEQGGDRPFLVWIHLIDPHGPYAAPVEPDRFVADAHAKPGQSSLPLGDSNVGFGDVPKYQILFGKTDPDYYVARYDAEIRYADDALGAFFARLRELGLYDQTLFVVTADHGETLDEPTHHRHFGHEFLAYEEDARIPLIVREPAGHRRLAALDANALFLSIDLAPTLLDLLGAEIPAAFEGQSLLRTARPPDDPVFSLGSYGSPDERTIGTQRGVLRGPWRYLINTKDGAEELYDRREDPHEAKDVAAAQLDQLAELRRLLAGFMAKPGQRNRASDLSAAERERLRALGYLR
jgi:arylsulfatase A-like enzyme